MALTANSDPSRRYFTFVVPANSGLVAAAVSGLVPFAGFHPTSLRFRALSLLFTGHRCVVSKRRPRWDPSTSAAQIGARPPSGVGFDDLRAGRRSSIPSSGSSFLTSRRCVCITPELQVRVLKPPWWYSPTSTSASHRCAPVSGSQQISA